MRGNPYVELVHWIHQILQLQDSDLHRIIRQFSDRPGAPGKGHHRSARPAAARIDVDLRPLLARRGGRGARLGLRHADVRRVPGSHRPPDRRDPQDQGACATRCSGSPSEFEKIKLDDAHRPLRRDHRRVTRGGPRSHRRVPGGRRRGSRRGERGHGARGDGQAGGAREILGRSDREGAQGRDRSDRRAATRRSGRSSTS